MSKAPSMPMYWDAYLADTTHLTTDEHGAYLLLLAAMWRRDGSVPDDDADNARILGITKAKWRKVKVRLGTLLTVEDGVIYQKNLRKIWQNTQEKIQKNRVNGAKGGRPKSSKNKDLDKANGFNSQNPIETIPEPEPEPYKEDTNVSLPLSLAPNDDQSDVSKAVDMFKDAAEVGGWPVPRILSKSRKSALAARLKECGGLSGWEIALEKAKASPHCCGQNDRGWVLTFDFITSQKNFAKLMEGNYDERTANTPNGTPAQLGGARCRPGSGTVEAFAAVAARMQGQQGRG